MSARPRSLFSTLLALATFYGSALASAAPDAAPSARLAYHRNVERKDCPDDRAFRALVTARLGHDPFEDASKQVLDITIAPDSGGLAGRAELTRDGVPAENRTIRAKLNECEALVEALASVVALQLTPRRETEPTPLPTLPPPPEPQRTAPPPAEPAPTPEPDRAPTTTTPIRFAARTAVVTSLGLLPAASIGGELGVGLSRGSFSAFAMGRGETQLGDARGDHGERLDAAAFAGGVMPCLSSGIVFGCGSIWLGVFNGRAPDAAAPSLGSSLISTVGARVGLGVPLGEGLRLAPQLDVVVPIVRTTLIYAGTPTWTMPALFGSAGLGLVYIPRS